MQRKRLTLSNVVALSPILHSCGTVPDSFVRDNITGLSPGQTSDPIWTGSPDNLNGFGIVAYAATPKHRFWMQLVASALGFCSTERSCVFRYAVW